MFSLFIKLFQPVQDADGCYTLPVSYIVDMFLWGLFETTEEDWGCEGKEQSAI